MWLKPFSQRRMTRLFYIANAVAADGRATEGTSASAAMVCVCWKLWSNKATNHASQESAFFVKDPVRSGSTVAISNQRLKQKWYKEISKSCTYFALKTRFNINIPSYSWFDVAIHVQFVSNVQYNKWKTNNIWRKICIPRPQAEKWNNCCHFKHTFLCRLLIVWPFVHFVLLLYVKLLFS